MLLAHNLRHPNRHMFEPLDQMQCHWDTGNENLEPVYKTKKRKTKEIKIKKNFQA